MKASELIAEYISCLNKYFHILNEAGILSIPWDAQMEKENLKTLEALTEMGQKLKNYLKDTPSLKEK